MTTLCMMNSNPLSPSSRTQAEKELAIIIALLSLATMEPDANFLSTFYRYGVFTPGQLSKLLWRLKDNKIPFVDSDFRMRKLGEEGKSQLRDIDKRDLAKIWPCMNSEQQEWYTKNVGEAPV